jgi:REase_DpnII-MboI/AbiJ N-terminal domain 3
MRCITMELVSAALRHNFREFCSTLPLRLIDDMFTGCGIRPGEVDAEIAQNVSGARRGRVEEYYASLDWTNPVDAQRFLRVISFALLEEYVPASYKESLRRMYSDAGFRVDAVAISLPAPGQENAPPGINGIPQVGNEDGIPTRHKATISAITRRDIVDQLCKWTIEGRLDLLEFLKMTWPDLDAMPSPFSKASLASDISRHMVAFPDWEYDFLLYRCLNLLECDDELFTIFLASCLHPLVRPDRKEVAALLSLFNEALSPDGYVFKVASYQSGRPIYQAVTFDTSDDEYIVPRAIETIERLARNLHLVVRRLSQRQHNRPPFEIRDEYDVQDLFHALLTPFFEDVRPEEVAPSLAGGYARIDFLIKTEQIVLEIKKTRPTLKTRELRDQLIVDKEIYRAHPDCRTFVAFVYDPDGYIENSRGFERDLSDSTGDLRVKVIVAPH